MTLGGSDQTGESAVMLEMLDRFPGWKCTVHDLSDVLGGVREVIIARRRRIVIDIAVPAADRPAAIAHAFAHVELHDLACQPFTASQELDADTAAGLYLGSYTADDFYPF